MSSVSSVWQNFRVVLTGLYLLVGVLILLGTIMELDMLGMVLIFSALFLVVPYFILNPHCYDITGSSAVSRCPDGDPAWYYLAVAAIVLSVIMLYFDLSKKPNSKDAANWFWIFLTFLAIVFTAGNIILPIANGEGVEGMMYGVIGIIWIVLYLIIYKKTKTLALS